MKSSINWVRCSCLCYLFCLSFFRSFSYKRKTFHNGNGILFIRNLWNFSSPNFATSHFYFHQFSYSQSTQWSTSEKIAFYLFYWLVNIFMSEQCNGSNNIAESSNRQSIKHLTEVENHCNFRYYFQQLQYHRIILVWKYSIYETISS